MEIPEVYDRAEAQEMVCRSQADYASEFGHPSERVKALLSLLGLDDRGEVTISSPAQYGAPTARRRR